MAAGFLSGIEALLLDQGLGKTRVAILSKQLEKHGGVAVKKLSESTTHILVGNITRLARVPVLLKIQSVPETVSVVRADWLSSCLAKRELLSEETYRVHPEYSPRKPSPAVSLAKKNNVSDTNTTVKPTTVSVPGQAKTPSSVSNPTQTSGGEEGTSADMDKAMLSPKAGMFGVTGRRWRQHKSNGGGPTGTAVTATAAWDSSDSDYVESDQSDNAETDKNSQPNKQQGPKDDHTEEVCILYFCTTSGMWIQGQIQQFTSLKVSSCIILYLFSIKRKMLILLALRKR